MGMKLLNKLKYWLEKTLLLSTPLFERNCPTLGLYITESNVMLVTLTFAPKVRTTDAVVEEIAPGAAEIVKF